MTKKAIDTAQEYLTVAGKERTVQIVNIQVLLQRHPPGHVLEFLRDLHQDYRKELRRLIARDKTDPKINDLIAKCFRVRMAINTMKNGLEVKAA